MFELNPAGNFFFIIMNERVEGLPGQLKRCPADSKVSICKIYNGRTWKWHSSILYSVSLCSQLKLAHLKTGCHSRSSVSLWCTSCAFPNSAFLWGIFSPSVSLFGSPCSTFSSLFC